MTGPTVVIPLLRYVRPTARLEAIVRWEGIAIDPIGALLAVLVFELLFAEPRETTVLHIAWLLFKTTAVGAGAGLIGAVATTILLARFWIPDKLQNPVVLMLVILTFALSNLLQAEAGLFAVTVMGILMANQKMVSVMHVVEFKENLRTLLLAGLFIMLAARLDMDDLTALSCAVRPSWRRWSWRSARWRWPPVVSAPDSIVRTALSGLDGAARHRCRFGFQRVCAAAGKRNRNR